MRSLLAAGEVEYFESSDSAITPALFELYQSVEPHSWKSRTGASIGRHPRWAEYFSGLLDARQPMKVSIQILSLDGVPVAGLITGAFEQTLYALHIITDDAVSHLAPGSALLLMSLRQAISGGYAAFNLLSGFGYYKVRWQAQMSETRNVQIYRWGGLAYWHRMIGDWKRWLLPAKSHVTPLLFNPMRRDVGDNEDVAPGKTPRLQLGGDDPIRIAALIAQIRKGAGEFLSAKELAMVMPFETRRAIPTRH